MAIVRSERFPKGSPRRGLYTPAACALGAGVKRGIECLRSGCPFAYEDPSDQGFVTCLLEQTDRAALAATAVPDDIDQVRAEGESLTSH